jgi:hypothetical protein
VVWPRQLLFQQSLIVSATVEERTLYIRLAMWTTKTCGLHSKRVKPFIGNGQPIFKHDFTPGSDIVGDILSGPKAAGRIEFEYLIA